ncbi:MAG: glycosyltransferase family 2 protein, partial [Oscillospiraceae bacterium]|nr:glycosyltransferase family 2 protein [Oscillospiraceae bacterium]
MSIFSIIIPVCNAEISLEKCMVSLVNQTYTNLEIILADNSNSTKCDDWQTKDNRIKVIRGQSCGISAARNAGIDAATGDYIIFADENSTFDSFILEKCMSEISSHSPDMLVCALENTDGDSHNKVFIDGNMYTRSEYTENISRYISTGIGFKTVTNKIFSANIVKSRNLHFSEEMPLVADELFNCRYFAAAGHIRCVSDLLCHSDNCSRTVTKGTAQYLAQGKEFSQKLIDAVQSKGLYGAASQAIAENYQKILYHHLELIAAKDNLCSDPERIAALEALSASADNTPLT